MITAAFLLRSILADEGDEFNTMVGWANILGFAVGAAGLAVLAFDRRAALRLPPTAAVVREAEESIARFILREEGRERARLMGTDEESTQPINVIYRNMIRYRSAGGRRIGDLDTVVDYYRSLDPGRLVILGEPGAGKTVLALHLLVRVLEERSVGRLGPDGRAWPVPVRFSLAAFDPHLTLEQWLVRQLVERFKPLPEAVASQLVEGRRILPVLDGLDEMDLDEGAPERAAAAIGRINAYLAGSAPSPVVVTCRLHRYEQLIHVNSTPAPATEVTIEPLDAGQIGDYLRMQLRNDHDAEAWRSVLMELDGPQAELLARALGSPWRLTLAVTICRDGASPRDLLDAAGVGPEAARSAAGSNTDPSDQVLAMLLARFTSAAVRLHPDAHYANAAEVEDWLAALSRHLEWQADQDQSRTDIRIHELWKVTHDSRPRVWHAVLTLTCSLIVGGLVGTITNGAPADWGQRVKLWITNFRDLSLHNLISGFSVIASIGLLVLILISALSEPRPAELDARVLQDRVAMGRRFRESLPLICAFAGITVLGYLAMRQVLETRPVFLAAYVILIFLFVTGAFVFTNEEPHSGRPIDALRNSTGAAFVTISIFGFLFAVGLAVTGQAFADSQTSLITRIGMSTAAGFGGALVAAMSLMVGGPLVVRYAIGVTIARRRGDLPARPAQFLDWASRAGIMRISGVAYQFRHQQLQAWLLRSEEKDNRPDMSVRGVAVDKPSASEHDSGSTATSLRPRTDIDG